MESTFTDRFPVRIYWEDTDAGGIVYHANYLKYMERARSELLARLEVSQQDERQRPDGVLFVVVAVDLRYHRAAVLGDDLTVVTTVSKLRHAALEFEQNIFRGDERITTGHVHVACVSAATMRPTVIPDTIYARVSELLSTDSN